MTSHAPPPDLSWLDLGPSDALVDLGTFRPPAASVGLGLAVHPLPSADPAAEWAAKIDAAPELEPAPVAQGRELHVEIGWWNHATPPVLVVDGGKRGAIVVAGEGAIDLDDGCLVLGAGGAPGRCRIVDDEVELALHVEAGTLRCFEIHRHAPAWATDDAPPSPAPSHPLAIDDVLAGWETEPWLGAVAAELASSESTLDVAAAAGAILRLWSSPPDARRAAVARLQAGEESPPDRVRVWLRAAPPGWASEAQATALLEADRLLDDVERAVGRGEAGLLHALVSRRDDLESVLAALDVIHASGGLRAALDVIDAVAPSRLDLPVGDDVADDPRIAAVAWMEPSAWWGALAGR